MNDHDDTTIQREAIQVGGAGRPPAGRNIQGGMDVFDSTGHQIGNVTELYLQPAIPPEGTVDQGHAGDKVGYFKMLELGALGLGVINAKELYIPFTAVQNVDTVEMRVTLNCTKEEAEERYQKEPQFVSHS
jgi:hypothetical protein